MRAFTSTACIDWSGAAVEHPPGLALATMAAGQSPRLVTPQMHAPRSGARWSRRKLGEWLQHQGDSVADVLVGIDMSFALPFADAGAYFPGWHASPPNARALWSTVDAMAQSSPHLGADAFIDHPAIAPHFRRHGGRTGAAFGGGIGRLRVVEAAQRMSGEAQSASVFNLVGAAQVGKSSLSGMRMLNGLSNRIPVWPFDPVPARGPLIVEIYTTLAARAAGVPRGRSKIRDAAALGTALSALGVPDAAAPDRIDDHACDALITAAWLHNAQHDARCWHPNAMTAEIATREGWTFGIR